MTLQSDFWTLSDSFPVALTGPHHGPEPLSPELMASLILQSGPNKFICKNKQIIYKKIVHKEFKRFSCDIWAIAMSTNFALPQEFDTQYLGPEHTA